jgi:hypothetical protein
VATAARRLDPDEITGVELPGQLRGLLLPVYQRPAARAVLPFGPARRRVAAPLGENG